MKTTLLFSGIILFGALGANSQSRPDIIIQYETIEDMDLYVIGNTGNSIVDPTDLEFHPDLSKNELWVVNKGSLASGGHTVIFSETGEATQTSLTKGDEFKDIYMSRVTGIAFSGNENFATCSGAFDAWDDGGDPFTGPTLWDSDLSVYGEPGAGDGSHIDDLHQSPYGQGITWEAQNIFWVFDGYNGDLVRYDFADDHGPGGDGESDAIVHRYGGLDLVRDPDDVVVSHLAMDQNNEMLYVVDHGNSRVIKIDVTTGELGGVPFFGPFEPLAEYREIINYDWEVVIEDTSVHEMSGIAIVNNKLLLADHETGDIIVYLTDGDMAYDEWFRIETEDPGIQGIEIGPDGRIFYANEFNNKVRRIDGSTLSIDEPIAKGYAMNIFPNPAAGKFTVDTDFDFDADDITIIALTGETVEFEYNQISSERAELVVDQLASGIFNVHVQNETGNVSKRLIVK